MLAVGIGGLGHMAVQILRALTPARLIAADIDDSKLAHAKELGAAHTVNTRDSATALEAIRDLAGPRGITVALDFVGAQATIDLCSQVVGRNSRLFVVGLAGGTVHYAADHPLFGCQVMVSYWGSRTELMEVIARAAAGRIHSAVENFPLDQAADVYQHLREGRIRGRAALLP